MRPVPTCEFTPGYAGLVVLSAVARTVGRALELGLPQGVERKSVKTVLHHRKLARMERICKADTREEANRKADEWGGPRAGDALYPPVSNSRRFPFESFQSMGSCHPL